MSYTDEIVLQAMHDKDMSYLEATDYLDEQENQNMLEALKTEDALWEANSDIYDRDAYTEGYLDRMDGTSIF